MHTRKRRIDQSLWAAKIDTAVYILNRTGKSGIKDKSPFEVWFQKKTNLWPLRVIGSCWKALKSILIGYKNDYGKGI